MGKQSVLFVCVENSCRSQMAEGFTDRFGSHVLEAFSAGSKPSGKVNPDAVLVMKELGVDISGGASKGFSDLPKRKFDYVITMGCGDVCPFVPARKRLDWKVPDPKGKDLAYFRKVRDIVDVLVQELIEKVSREN